MAYISLNPFNRFIETEKFQYARTVRSSFFEKMSDGFFLFVGDRDYPGLIEYATLFLSDYFPPVYLIVLMVGAVAMLVALPIVGLVHFVSRYFNNNEWAMQEIHGAAFDNFEDRAPQFIKQETYDDSIYELQKDPELKKGPDNIYHLEYQWRLNGHPRPRRPLGNVSLREFLDSTDLTLNDLYVEAVKKKQNCPWYVFSFSATRTGSAAKLGREYSYTFEMKLPENEAEALVSKQSLSSFFKSNAAGITTYCEERDPDIINQFIN